MFNHEDVRIDLLKKWSHNLRWAVVPDGVIPLTAADPDFGAASPIREALERYARDGHFGYGPPEGLESFRESMSAHYAGTRQVHVPADRILPVDSAAFGILLICRTMLKPGDEAIIFDPVDFLFRYSVETVGATAVPLTLPQGVPFNPEAMEASVTPKTRMICLCNPLNPTGKVFSRQELLQLAEVARRHDLTILSDEIWSDIVFKPFQFTSIASLAPEIAARTITVTGFSKSYGLAALRIGAVLSPDAHIHARLLEASLHHATVHGANVPGQVAAQAALDECGGWLESFVHHLHRMRDLTVDRLNGIKGFRCVAPQGCYVAFADIRNTGLTSAEVHQRLMDSARVAVVPGLPKWFGQGADGFIRISFATSVANMEEAMDRMTREFGTA